MPSQHTLTVALTAQLRGFIVDQIASGPYRTANEVGRAALRAFERNEGAEQVAIAEKANPGQGARPRAS